MYSPRVCRAAESLVRPWLLPPLVLSLLVATVLPTCAAIIKVPADYANIQSAIFLANNGDTILVSPGRYAAFDFSGKAVTVESTNPTSASVVASTVIDGATAANTVTFEHGEGRGSILTGFTITGATTAAVAISASSAPQIINCVITGNAIGISATGGSPALIQGCTIQYNSGLGITTDSSCTITQNVIKNNAGGIATTGSAYITYNTITNNTLSTDGAGVLANASGIVLQGNIIAYNTSDGNGGGISCVLGTRLESNTFYGNAAGKVGGNIYATINTVFIHNCIVTNATAGGGIGTPASIIPVVAYCDVEGNAGGDYVVMPDQTGSNGNIKANPLFANPGGGDFHLMSQAGRWNPQTSAWALDSVTSPCIDAGDPGSPYNLEPAPNGSRINMGAYGDTTQASKSIGIVLPPSITKGPSVTPSPVVEGATAQCSVTATDKPTYTLTYQWTAVDSSNNPAGTFDNATLATPKWTAPSTITGNSQQFTLRVLVSSSSGKTAQGSIILTVITPPADAVNITAGPTATPASLQVSQQTACSVTAVDTDGYTLTYAWTATDAGGNPAGKFDNPTSATPKWTAPATIVGSSQTFTLTVVVTNSKGLTATGSVSVQVKLKPDLVTITGGPAATPGTISQGQQALLSVQAKDALGNPLTYAWTARDSLGHPAGTFNNPTVQNPKWTAPITTALGNLTYTLTVLITCPTSGATATKSTTVTVLVDQLVLNTPANGNANPVLVGENVDCNVSITDSLGYAVTYAWTAKDGRGNNVGSFDNPASQTPVWTAPASLPKQQFTYIIKVTARSTQGTTVTSSFTQLVVENDTFVMSLPSSGQFMSTGVQPATAAPGSTFTFQINYLDTANLAPQSVHVRVWAPDGVELSGSPFPMVSSATTWRTGVLFTAARVLSTDGLYHYQFVVRGPTGTVKRLPATGSEAGPFVNTPPVASWVGTTGYTNGGVQPTSGVSGTQFVFQVKYSQAEGNAPTFVRLWVWGTLGKMQIQGNPFTMTTTNLAPNYKTGVVYQKTLTLNLGMGAGAGTCQYRFEVSDGGPSVTLPATGTVLGPGLTGTVSAASVASLSGQQVGEGVTLTYTLAAPAQVEVVVLNVAGRIIADLTPDGPQAAGIQSLRWNGRNLAGSLVPAGVYLLRVNARAPDGTQAQGLTAVSMRR